MRIIDSSYLVWCRLRKSLIFTHRRFNTSTYKFYPPKNKTSVRYIPISEETIEELRSLKKIQEVFYRELDLGVIAKILGHKNISMLVKVYGSTLEERIIEEFKQIRSIS